MKLVTVSRLIFSLALASSLSSTPLFSQDEKDEKPESAEIQDRPQRGQDGGQEGGQRGQGGGQRGQGNGQRGQQEDLSPEERLKRINEMIQNNVIEMAEAVELREDQQELFVKTQASHEVQLLKVRGKMQAAGRDRQQRQQLMQELQKLNTTTTKAMKKVLDKEQFKAFQAKMEERQPQRGGGGGRGGQGR